MASTVSNKVVRFGAVEFPASLRAASETKDVKLDRARAYTEVVPPKRKGGKETTAVRFERITRKDLGQETDEVADATNVVYGAWTDDGFKQIPVADLDAIKALGETEKVGKAVLDLTAIEIQEFVPLKHIDFARSVNAYFLAPQKGGIGGKPMKLLRAILKKKKVAGVFKFVVKSGGRQKLGVVHESDGRLLVNVLEYAENFAQANESREILDSIDEPDKRLIEAAGAFVDALTVEAEDSILATAKDSAVEAKAEALEGVLDGKSITRPEVTPTLEASASVDILLERLRESVEQAKVAA